MNTQFEWVKREVAYELLWKWNKLFLELMQPRNALAYTIYSLGISPFPGPHSYT
jgi:hypothetical protein